MDTRPLLYADADASGNSLVARGPPALVIPARSVFTHDLFDASPGQNASWFSTKEDHFYRTKEDPISPILQESDSDETISCTESMRQSPEKNSFGSIARDASFLEFYTEVVDALTPPRAAETVCQVTKTGALFGAVKSFQCEVRVEAETFRLQATRQLRLGQMYTIYKKTQSDKHAVARVIKTGQGEFKLETTGGQEMGRVSFCAKESHGVLHRLAEGTIFEHTKTSMQSLPLRSLKPSTSKPQRPSKVTASSKNFQMTHNEKVVFQLGKVQKRTYEMRFVRPVDSVLAFGFAVCSLIQSNH